MGITKLIIMQNLIASTSYIQIFSSELCSQTLSILLAIAVIN
jgi:hypothetical protein